MPNFFIALLLQISAGTGIPKKPQAAVHAARHTAVVADATAATVPGGSDAPVATAGAAMTSTSGVVAGESLVGESGGAFGVGVFNLSSLHPGQRVLLATEASTTAAVQPAQPKQKAKVAVAPGKKAALPGKWKTAAVKAPVKVAAKKGLPAKRPVKTAVKAPLAKGPKARQFPKLPAAGQKQPGAKAKRTVKAPLGKPKGGQQHGVAVGGNRQKQPVAAKPGQRPQKVPAANNAVRYSRTDSQPLGTWVVALDVIAPPNGNIAPAGMYWLHVIDQGAVNVNGQWQEGYWVPNVEGMAIQLMR